MRLLNLILVFFSSLNVFAGLSDDFEAIKNLSRDLEPTGAICEEVAQLRFSEKYPQPQYRVVTGIEYSDRDGTLGELDLIVFNNETQTAEFVGEVKCWKNPKGGLKKAKEQRDRFLKNVASSKALKFKWLGDPSVKLTKTQFNKVKDFFYIAQSGTIADGFDFELPYSLRELMELRMEILRCQNEGRCPRPRSH
jgi:hypothetical protein